LGLPVWLNLTIDWRVFVFTLAVSLITGVVFGLAPALQASKPELVSTLKDEAGTIGGGRRKGRVRNTLVVAQIALSLVALVGAGLFIRSLQYAQMLKPGFNPDHVLLASLDVFPIGYDQTKGLVFYQQLLERLKQIPGVQSISFADKLPLAIFGDTSQGASIEGYTPGKNEDLNFQFDTVGPDYFQTMKIPLAAGREFTERDNQNAPAVVGLYSVIAYTVSQRTHEIGIRIALGARTGHVFRLVIGQGIFLTVVGIGAGIVTAVVVMRFVSSLLFGVTATDPMTFISVA